MKLVLPERLAEALMRVRGKERSGKRQKAHEAVALAGQDGLLCEIGSSGHFRKVSEVLCIQSDGKYTEVRCKDGQTYVVRRSISHWQKILPEDAFLRLDRRQLVNRREIQGVDFAGRLQTVPNSSYRVVLLHLGRFTRVLNALEARLKPDLTSPARFGYICTMSKIRLGRKSAYSDRWRSA